MHTVFQFMDIRRLGLAALMLLLAAQVSVAQSTDGEEEDGDWYSEEDEEDTLSVGADEGMILAKYSDVLIRVNGKEEKLQGEYAVKREDTLDIQVRHLAPGSAVILEMQKGGINLKRKVFYANNQGELDLEVQTGSKKVTGDAILYYTPKGNAKKTLEVKIVVD